MALPVEDVVSILQLVARYNHLIDAGDGDEFAALFVEDGSLDTGLGMIVEGRGALAEFAAGVPTMVAGARHVATNVVVDGDGTEATVRAYLQMLSASADASQTALVISGIYHDTLRKDDGTWRFVDRRLVPDA